MSPKRRRPAGEPEPQKERATRASPEAVASPSTAGSGAVEASDGEAGGDRAEAKTEPACPIVGIGASAGGLEAIQELLEALGDDPKMAFVVVQHLAPSRASLLRDILGRATRMPVRTAEDGVEVLPDHVYVIPPDRDMTISGGRLRLAKRPEGHERHLPIDHFFRSLAEDCGIKSIGIVLSGTSSDGAAGLQTIKTAGGITFAQEERSAKHPEMPRAAVALGDVDYVLTPMEVARELLRLRDHAYVLRPPKDGDALPSAETEALEQVFQILRATAGTDFTQYKPTTIRRRILRRMALARMERIEDYLRLLRESRAEVQALYDDVLINVTSFFRDPAAFKALQSRVFPALLRRRTTQQRVRVWVPGCSTGEEVYSIAMCLFEALGDRSVDAQLQIFGTDVSETVVERARAGKYPAAIASDVSADRLRRFFVRTPDGYQVGKALRDACVFAKHDLVKDPPFSKIDLVSCRNVLIYFGAGLQRKAVGLFHYALRPDGFLMLGASENVASSTDLFTLLDKRHRIYAKRAIPSRLYFGPGVDETRAAPPPVEATVARVAEARTLDLQREADRVLMSRYVPAALVVDDNLDILQFRGHTGPYLEPRSGNASLNLLKMTREGLLLDLRAAFQRARRDGVAVRRDKVRMKTEDQVVDVSIEVIPFTSRHTRGRLYLVLFDSAPAASGKSTIKGRGRAGSKEARAKRSSTAEQELAATKDYLQTIIEEQEATNEELMSANEEILSSNEELQSTNEELETAKEELQSSNEELSTVNDELQNRNVELSDVNDDLTNLLAIIHVPMVILDADLRVRRATPAGERMLNLIPADVGRRVTDVRPNVDIPDLEKLVHQVVDSVTPKRLDVRDHQGRWFAMNVRPYKTRTQKIDGVVITWTELDTAPARAASSGSMAAILAAVARPAAFLDTALRVEAANAAWREAFPPPSGDDPTAWGDPGLTDAIRAVASGGPAVESLRAECLVGAPSARVLRVALSLVTTGDVAGPSVLVIVREVERARGG
jgi:two-component system CheB/CheR fusion protein